MKQGARRCCGVRALCKVGALLFSSAACAADLEPFLLLQHTSDLLRGPPFNTKDEGQQDFLAAGVTIIAGERRAWELDLAHGVKWIDRGEAEHGTQLAVRFYPGRFHGEKR